jgi:hypothetical protein
MSTTGKKKDNLFLSTPHAVKTESSNCTFSVTQRKNQWMDQLYLSTEGGDLVLLEDYHAEEGYAAEDHPIDHEDP